MIDPNVIIDNGNYHLMFAHFWLEKVILVSLKWESDWPYAVNFTSLSSETATVTTPTTTTFPQIETKN